MTLGKLINKKAVVGGLKKRWTDMPKGMGLLGSILDACDYTPGQGSLGRSSSSSVQGLASGKGFGNKHSKSSSLSKVALIAILVVGVVILAILAILVVCCIRRNAKKRRAQKQPPKFYPEVSSLYDPPPTTGGAPSPFGAPYGSQPYGGASSPMLAARDGPDTSYLGAAGVAAASHHGNEGTNEKEGLLSSNLPSARSMLAPLSGYKRAEQHEGEQDLAEGAPARALSPFRDQIGGEYRDSVDGPRH